VLVLEVVLIGWVVFRVAQVYLDLRGARSAAAAIEAALRDQRAGDALGQVAPLQKHSARAESGTSGPVWRVLEHVPFMGDDARTLATVSDVVDELATQAVPSAVGASKLIDREGLVDGNGAVDLAAIKRVAPDLARAHRAFESADTELGQLDTTGNVGRIASAYDELSRVIQSASSLLDSADTAVSVLPAMTGADGPRRYLLVLENNAELRSSGGFPGVAVELSATHGKVTLGKPISSSAVFKKLERPILPITSEERALFGDFLGEYFVDANFTPDFPRTAQLMAARWEREEGTRLDGVLMMDTVSLAYLLRATGPMTIDGVRLDADNAVSELLGNTYVRLAGQPAEQDAFFQKVTQAVFTRLTGDGANPTELVAAVARAASEGRIKVRSFHDAEVRRIGDARIAGIVPRDKASAQLGVYLNDATIAKMNIFLDYAVNLASTSCRGDRQRLAMDMTLKSGAPKDMSAFDDWVTGGGFYAPIGSQALVVYLYPPVGGSVSTIQVDGRAAKVTTRPYLGREVATISLLLGPGETQHLTWSTTTGPGQTGDVKIDVTPSAVRGTKSAIAASTC